MVTWCHAAWNRAQACLGRALGAVQNPALPHLQGFAGPCRGRLDRCPEVLSDRGSSRAQTSVAVYRSKDKLYGADMKSRLAGRLEPLSSKLQHSL